MCQGRGVLARVCALPRMPRHILLTGLDWLMPPTAQVSKRRNGPGPPRRPHPSSGVLLGGLGAGLTFLVDFVVQCDGATAPLNGPVCLLLRARLQGDTLPLALDAAF